MVNDKSLQFEIDTGASVSIVSELTYGELWPDTPLQDTTVKLKTYTGTPLTSNSLPWATVRHTAIVSDSRKRSKSHGPKLA